MIKRNGQPARHDVPHYSGRLTDEENEAYQIGVTKVQAQLINIAAIGQALRTIETAETPAVQPAGEIRVDNEPWQFRRSLVQLTQSEVLLCRKGDEVAVVERFAENSRYATANGPAEILLTGNNERQVLQDFVENERQTLQLLASDLTAKIRETLAEERPELNCRRVVEAVERRCDYEINQTQSESETQSAAITQSQGIRV